MGSVICMHGNSKSVCHVQVKCWKFLFTQTCMLCMEISMPCSGQVFACMEISIHPKVYALLGSSVCMHGNFYTPKSICPARVKCLHAWKFPYIQKYMPCSGQVFACMEISIHPKVYAVVFACLEISIHPKVYAVVFACLEISIHPKVYAVVFACLEISIHPKAYAIFACFEISIHPKVVHRSSVA